MKDDVSKTNANSHEKDQATDPPTYNTSAWEKNACPHCGSLVWVRIHRSWWQKLLKPNQELHFCRECRQQFWR
jgi:hypothetical protein